MSAAPTIVRELLTVRERAAIIERADRQRRAWNHVMTCTRPRCETCARADLGEES